MLNKKLLATSSIVTTGLLLLAQGSAFASTNLEIGGNGRNSDNQIYVSSYNTTAVSQSNTARINNNVSVNSNTGNNTSSDNIGGDTHVTSGPVSTNVEISNDANHNVATINGCNCGDDGINADISSNGRGSDNTIVAHDSHNQYVNQTNNADFHNNVDVNANTGYNRSSDNGGNNSNWNYQPDNDWSMYSNNFWKEYWKEFNQNNNWMNPNFWSNFCNSWNNQYGNGGNSYNGGNNGGDTNVSSGNVSSDIFLHNMANTNQLSM